MVRVLRTIGYDVGFRRGAGQYLYDRTGARYLDLLSGFGVFGIGRNHPALRTALESVLDAELPNLVQMDVPPLGGRSGGAAAGESALSGQGILCQFRHRDGGSGDQVRPRGNRPLENTVLRARLSRADLRRAVAEWRRDLQEGFRAAARRLRGRSIQRSERARERAAPARCRGLHRGADPGQGRSPAVSRLSEIGGRPLPPLWQPVHRRRNSVRPWPHRQVLRRRSLGRRAGHDPGGQGAVGRPCAGRRAADTQGHLRSAVQPDGPRRGAWFDLRQERSRDGGRHRDACRFWNPKS